MWFIPPWVQSSILLPCPLLPNTNLTLPMMLSSLKSFSAFFVHLIQHPQNLLTFLQKARFYHSVISSTCYIIHIYHTHHIFFIHHLLDTDVPNVTYYEYTTNMYVKISQNFAYFFSFGFIPSTRIDSSQGGSIYGILRTLYIMSSYGSTSLYSHQQCIESCLSLQLHQHRFYFW